MAGSPSPQRSASAYWTISSAGNPTTPRRFLKTRIPIWRLPGEPPVSCICAPPAIPRASRRVPRMPITFKSRQIPRSASCRRELRPSKSSPPGKPISARLSASLLRSPSCATPAVPTTNRGMSFRPMPRASPTSRLWKRSWRRPQDRAFRGIQVSASKFAPASARRDCFVWNSSVPSQAFAGTLPGRSIFPCEAALRSRRCARWTPRMP